MLAGPELDGRSSRHAGSGPSCSGTAQQPSRFRSAPGRALYFAKLSGRRRTVGFAPFVVRSRPGDSRVAVVLPTNTWQAYNFRDEDGDGTGDTWYANPSVRTVRLARPYLDQGVPPHLSGFTRWLAKAHLKADHYSDDDLQAVRSGDELARRYDLIVFSGHEEYTTVHAFDIIRRYRDLGGNLAFLSANNLFAYVQVHGQRMTCSRPLSRYRPA